MPNAGAMIQESIWRDRDFRQLSRGAQTLYVQLLSQKELDCAGMLPLQPDKWATGCEGLTTEQVWADLNELQDARFVYYDLDTYEAFIRTHVRNSNVMKVPNMRKSARRSAALVGSTKLRSLLAAELRATGDSEMAATADEIDPSGRVAEPLANPSKPEPLANPSGTLAEPTGVGMGMGMGVTVGRYLSVGGTPRPVCRKHPENSDEGCRACMKRREWDEAAAEAAEADELRAKREARERAESCAVCHGTNWIPDTEPAVRCDHEPAKAGHA